jgi:hypothetical protein
MTMAGYIVGIPTRSMTRSRNCDLSRISFMDYLVESRISSFSCGLKKWLLSHSMRFLQL